MSLTKLYLGGNTDVIYTLFQPRKSLVSDFPAGDGNIEQLFLQCGPMQLLGNFQGMNGLSAIHIQAGREGEDP